MVGQTGRSLILISIGALIASVAPDVWVLLLALAALTLLLLPLRWRLARVTSQFYGVVWLSLGAIWVDGHWQHTEQTALAEDLEPFETLLTGRVSQLSQTGMNLQFDFHVSDVSTGLEGSTLAVKCYRCVQGLATSSTSHQLLQNHQRWQLSLKIRPLVGFKNPGGMSYRQWMLAQGYAATAYVLTRKGSQHNLLDAQQVEEPSWLDEYRQTIYSWLAQAQGAGFLSALVLGDKNALSADQKRLLMGSGLGHLFVISGLHVGLVALMFYGLASLALRPLLLVGMAQTRPWALLVGLCGAGLYAVLSGLQVPAMRAWLMLAFAVVVLLSHRRMSPLHLLNLALLAVLILQPLAFKSMGAWLSFTIVAALMWGFWGRISADGAKSGVGSRMQRGIAGLLVGQYYAFCAGALVLIAYGIPVSIVGIALNLLMIPLFSFVVLPLALLGLVWAGVTASGYWLGVTGQLLDWVFVKLAAHQDLVMTTMSAHAENRLMLMAGLLLLLWPRGLGMRALGGALLLAGVALPHSSPKQGVASVAILDVGQGSAAVVRTQHHAILIDTGRAFASGMTLVDFVVLPFLRERGIGHLDKVLISHGDSDHSGGLPILRQWGPPISELVTQEHCPSKQWQWDVVVFEQFQAHGFNQGNNGSCQLRVTAGQRSILFSGDIERKAEQAMVRDRSALPVDVLVVPHHGSRTSSSENWLQQLNPSLAIVSAGRFNGYGHPHPDVVARYQALGVSLLGTYSHGAIEVELGAGQTGLKVSTYAP